MAAMEDTNFDKIIRREISADIVYEDDATIAFLDIRPNNPGHTLVVPKKQVINIFDADDETLAALMRTIRKIAPAIRDAVGADGLNINSNHGKGAGQLIFRLHFHIIPRFANDGYTFWPQKEYAPGEMQQVAEKIRSKII